MRKFLNQLFSESQNTLFNQTESNNDQEIQIATGALLIEMAQSDGEFSEEELDHILQILGNEFNLSMEYARELSKHARKRLNDSMDLWKFTNQLNLEYAREEKVRVIELLWRVIYADGKLDAHEDYLVHKLALLLNIPHEELIAAKLRVLNEAGQ